MNNSLYALSAEYQAAAERLSDLDLPDEVIADTLEGMAGAIELKGQQIGFLVRNHESLAEQIKAAENEMAKRRKAHEARAESLKKYLLQNLQATKIQKIECAYFKISVRDNPESVVVDCDAEIPKDYFKEVPASYVLDKMLVKRAFKDGYIVPGAHIDRTQRLDIK